jgi:hypothetical protein
MTSPPDRTNIVLFPGGGILWRYAWYVKCWSSQAEIQNSVMVILITGRPEIALRNVA